MIRTRDILAASEAIFAITRDELLGNSRYQPLVHERMATMYVIRFLRGESYPSIGKLFGKDHTTILDNCRRVKEDVKLGELAEELLEEIDAEYVSSAH